MSQIISFSADRDFAAIFDDLIQQSGYKNRSRFLRDAALYFAEVQQKGDLMDIDDQEVVEAALSNNPNAIWYVNREWGRYDYYSKNLLKKYGNQNDFYPIKK